MIAEEVQYNLLFIALSIALIGLMFFFKKLNKLPYSLITGLYLLGIISGALISIGKFVYTNYEQPPEWDFLGFWLNSKVALSNTNFYEPENHQSVSLPYEISNEFQEEIIDVGFWYPPFSMFLFLPLGFFNISEAYFIWQFLNLLLCFLCIFEIWKLLLKDYGVLGLLLVAVLMFRLTAVRSTFVFAQTNFFTLLFFLFFWKTRNQIWSGFWLALCVVVKPYMALLFLYPLIKKQWRILVSAILCLLTLTLLSVFAFGIDVFISFLNNPTPNAPDWIYLEQTNQSLLSTILRITEYTEKPYILNPIYLISSLILTLITIGTLFKYKNSNTKWGMLLILFLALIIYPANQMFYSVFLIIPICLLISHTFTNSTKEKIMAVTAILIIYLLTGYQYGNYTFFANLFTWFLCLVSIILMKDFIYKDRIPE